MNRNILFLGIGLITIACTPRRDEWCYGHTLKHCEPSVYFEFDSDKLDSQDMQKLTWVVDKIKRWDDRKVVVSGHADMEGTDEYNKELSLRRAEAVKSYLVEEGISADRIETQAFGRQKLLTSDENDQDKNRRVDITFGHKEGKFFLTPDVLCEATKDL